MFSPLIDNLISALRCLPSVGPKSAQRMALQLLERDRDGAIKLADALQKAMQGVERCSSCRNLTEEPVCGICRNQRRNQQLMCVVEQPADVLAIESSGSFSGRYFVLLGKLSPIDGIGPRELGIDLLLRQVAETDVTEVIIATNPTVEGEATANYIADHVKSLGVSVSRIAHGVPLGGELEFIDGGTLAHALGSRKVLD